MTTAILTETPTQMVHVNSIDCSPGPYCMSFEYDLNPLILSINHVGLLNSPMLLASDHSNKLLIISGYRRLEALRHLGIDTIPCRIFQASDLDPLHCLLLNLYDNLSTRELNHVEKAMVLVRLENIAPEKTIIEEYLPVLGLLPRKDIFSLYTRMVGELGESGKTDLAMGRLSLQAVKILLDLKKNTRDAILDFFSNLRLNTNQQRQLIDFIVDISIIEKRSVSNLLSDSSIREIEVNNRMNGPQKAKAVMKLFRKRRLPSVVKAEKEFNKAVSDLMLPGGVRIMPPPFFEGADYKMEIPFRDGLQLRKVLEKLSAMERLAAIGNPWEKNR